MPDIYGSHFEFGGQSSRRYKLIIANVETDRLISVSGTIQGNTVFDSRNKRRFMVDDNYRDSPLSFDVDIITDDGSILHYNERREIEKWLFNRRDYQRFYIDLADDYEGTTSEFIEGERKRLYLNCRFINPVQLEYNGGIVGFRVTMETDSGLWWQDDITKEFQLGNTLSTDRSTINVYVDSDIDDYTYPCLAVAVSAAGNDSSVKIINNSDNTTRITEFEHVLSNVMLKINSENGYVTQSYFAKFISPNFPRLVNGNNNITVIGAVEAIAICYRNRRFL